jgi:hypothetical protein
MMLMWLVLLRQSDDPRVTVVAYAIGIVVSLLVWNHKNLLHERATARSHVAEVSRDVAVPDHCVICGRPHATIGIPIRAIFPQGSPWRFRNDPSRKTHYVFRFCRDCARRVRRRHRTGIGVLWFGVFLVLFSFIEPLFAIGNRWNWPVTELIMTFGIFGGIALFYGGIWVRLYIPQVRPIDYGGEKIFFRFQNQVFRNHFAELNGEQ